MYVSKHEIVELIVTTFLDTYALSRVRVNATHVVANAHVIANTLYSPPFPSITDLSLRILCKVIWFLALVAHILPKQAH